MKKDVKMILSSCMDTCKIASSDKICNKYWKKIVQEREIPIDTTCTQCSICVVLVMKIQFVVVNACTKLTFINNQS